VILIHRFMPGTGVIPHQTSQGNIGNLMNGQNPDVKYGSGLLERKFGTGAEIPLELAGQNPEAAAQQAIQILKDECESFNGPEFKKLVGAAIEAIQEIFKEIGLRLNNLTSIVKGVQSRAMPFNEEADRLSIETSAAIQQVLSNNSGSTQNSNEPPLSFLGPKPPSKQDPQGSVLAA
jgi:hypothetical protein